MTKRKLTLEDVKLYHLLQAEVSDRQAAFADGRVDAGYTPAIAAGHRASAQEHREMAVLIEDFQDLHRQRSKK